MIMFTQIWLLIKLLDVLCKVSTTETPNITTSYYPSDSTTQSSQVTKAHLQECIDSVEDDYFGTVNVTRSGITCQRWDSQYPHTHSYGYLFDQGNYCRNPTNDGPWCYTTSEDKRWEYCDIEFCDAGQCTPDFTCGNGSCVNQLVRCNGYDDCDQGEDEQNCFLKLSATKEICKPDTGCQDELLDVFHVTLCQNSSSSVYNCENDVYNSLCASRFDCGNGVCVDMRTICDGDMDCVNGYDEQICGIGPNVQPEECLRSTSGWEYKGHTNVTVSGRDCQRWDSDTPHGIGDDRYKNDENYCRFGTYNYGLHCYTMDPNIMFEECYVPQCKTLARECMDRKTDKYLGVVNMTRQGVQCQRWDSQTPHAHTHGFLSDQDNNCRNVNGEKPWCYTTDRARRWDYCNIPLCSQEACEPGHTCTGGTCADHSVKCDGKKDCIYGDDEHNCVIDCSSTKEVCKPGTSCHYETRQCHDVYFCRNSTLTDECENVVYNALCSSLFRCDTGTGRCIDPRSVCDGVLDCTDGIDELNCTINCLNENVFNCTDDVCIPYTMICDGFPHCPNAFDEENCDWTVMKQCQSDSKIKTSYGVNKRRVDQRSCFALLSEETDCHAQGGYLITINSQQMQTHVTHYLGEIPKNSNIRIQIGLSKLTGNRLYHDFIWDDGSPLVYTSWSSTSNPNYRCVYIGFPDEANGTQWYESSCPGEETRITDLYSYMTLCLWKTPFDNKSIVSLVPRGNLSTSNQPGLFECGSGEFVSFPSRCDKNMDCTDGSDEIKCDISKMISVQRCDDGTPIPLSSMCDLSAECTDWSDENFCIAKPCTRDEWKCNNGECIPLDSICNSQSDCKDRSDETINACYGSCKEKDLFACDGGNCIQRSLITDDVFDCIDKTDKVTERVEPFCPDNGKDRIPWYINVGDEQLGPIEVFCSDGTSIVLNSASIKTFDPERNTTIWSLKYGSDSILNKLLGMYEYCIQETYTEKPRAYSNDRIDSMKINYTENYKNRFEKFMMSYSQYTGGQHGLIWKVDNKTNLPVRTIVFDGFHVATTVHTLLGCKNQRKSELLDSIKTLGRMSCKTGGADIYSRNKCLLNIKRDGTPYGCRDMSHLENCGTFVCPYDYVKCQNSFCIHVRLVCDGQPHCPNNEDERGCDHYICRGMYRCKNSRSCVPQSLLCDGTRHCPLGDDERLCGYTCPTQCYCEDVAIRCNSALHLDIIPAISKHVRYMDLSNTNITLESINLPEFIYLIELNISGCGILELTTDTLPFPFLNLNNLQVLDVSYNSLSKISGLAFDGLKNIKKLNLDGNNLVLIDSLLFKGHSAIEFLSMSLNKLVFINNGTFSGLVHLQFLNLSFNALTSFDMWTFNDLSSLSYLDLRGNEIPPVQNMFQSLVNLRALYSDSSSLCCAVKEEYTGLQPICIAPQSYISSCENLIKQDILRISIWFMGGAALVGNVFVLTYRLVHDIRRTWHSHAIFVISLSISDCLMGLYMLIIAAVDVQYRASYTWHDVDWRSSQLCTVAGILATVSNQASAMLICLIAVDRYISIKYPFSKLRPWICTVLAVACGLLALLIALVPVMLTDYFAGEFYSRSAVCIALPLTSYRPKGWGYSVAVFVVFNMIIFMTVGVIQVLLYMEVRSSAMKARGKQAQVEAVVARSLTTVILTDFGCWFPIGLLGFLSLGGLQISTEVYAWIIVFVLPINSALNPFLYTISAIRKKQVRSSNSDPTQGVSITNGFLKMYHRLGAKKELPSREHNCIRLSEYLNHGSITAEHVETIKDRLLTDIEYIHDKNVTHGHICEETVYVVSVGMQIVDVFLDFQHKRITEKMDDKKDMQDFQALTKRLRQSVTKI